MRKQEEGREQIHENKKQIQRSKDELPEATVEESHLTQENRIKIEGFRQKG